MSDEPLANKSQPPSALSDAEYDVIYATLSETAQGRRFLEDHARRCQSSDTEASLATIERMQAVIRDRAASEHVEILLEIADMAQAIVRLRAEILAMRPPNLGPLEATEELDSIVHMTEGATSRILAAAEQVQEIAWTMRESGSIEALCDELDLQATEIYTACSFQDLTGQRTHKVIQVLRYLEDRINAMVLARDKDPTAAAAARQPLYRPGLMQADVDAVMQPQNAGQEERQDATLEDIGREMLAIEPMIELQQAEAQRLQATEEVRPELTVAETIMAEEDNARPLTEWEVDPAQTQTQPVQAKPFAENNAPMMDWVVEHPEALQPDSEPAWMILRRMEAELDEQGEAKAEEPVVAPTPPTMERAAPVFAQPAVAPSPATAEPGLSVAQAMSQLAQELRSLAVLPLAERSLRTKLATAESLAELETAMVADKMKFGPSDEAAASSKGVPAPNESATHVEGEPATPGPTQRPASARTEAARSPAQSHADDILFAADRLQQETPQPPAGHAPPPVVRGQAAPETLRPPQGEPEQPKSDARHDPLAPLRALSDAQKIALFS